MKIRQISVLVFASILFAPSQAAENAEFQMLLENYVQSVNQLDLDLAEQIWSQSEAVSFIQPRGHQRSFEEIKQNFYLGAMANFSERNLVIKDLSIHQLGEDTAWAEFYWDFAATFTDGKSLESSGRETQLWKKEAHGWKIVHVHYSGPATQAARQGF